MNKQNAVVARNYATQKYADILSTKTNSLSNQALNIAEDATANAHRDDYLFNNNYTGTNRQFNNSLVKVGGEYAYITQGGAARQIQGGILTKWSDTGNDNYVKFSGIPYSNCPNSVTNLSNYSSIDDLKSKKTSIFSANAITDPTLTACGSEGELVYINKFMEFKPVKMGGDNRFQVGEGNGFVYLEKWKTSDWERVVPLAAQLACDSGYQVMKLVINNVVGIPYVFCYGSDYNIEDIGLSDNYETSKGGNKSTVNGPCPIQSKYFPSGDIDKFSSEVIDGLPTITRNGGKIQSQKYITRVRRNGQTTTTAIPCTNYTEFTQPYNITCNKMSDYPTSVPSGIQRCNAVYAVWYQGIKNSNIYVGNVGYITPDGEVQHISKNMLMFVDKDIDKLITYQGKRVCMQSKQYASNTDQILKTANMSLEAAKIWCANNTNCAGFHILNDTTVTFFKKTGVQCGETLQTLNSMLPLTEDPYTYENGCTTVWKPLVLKIQNRNNDFLKNDNINNPTFGKKNRGKDGVSDNYFYNDVTDYNPDVRNITGGCPYTIKSGLYGQLWYGYRNNGYTPQSDEGFLCKTLQNTTSDYYTSYVNTKLPNSINQIKTQLLPNLQYVANTLKNIMNASKQKESTLSINTNNNQVEGLTTIEKEYGDEIVNVLNQTLPKKVNFNGDTYTIVNKNQLNSYGIIKAQLEQGLITSGDANIQMSVLFNSGNPNAAIMKGKNSSELQTTTDNTTDDSTDATVDATTEATVDATTDATADATTVYKRHGPVEYPSTSTKTNNVINIIDSMSENSQGLNQQMGNIIKQFNAMGEETTGTMEAMDEDSSVIMMKNLYGYGGWIIVSFLIIFGILIFGFNLIPSLNNKLVLMYLSIVLGIVSALLIVVKYDLLDKFKNLSSNFIYHS